MNIAECRKRLEELAKERKAIYESKLQSIDAEVTKLNERIKKICQHHEDMLLIVSEIPEDEYGKMLTQSEYYDVNCSICGAYRRVYASYMKKAPAISFSDLFDQSYDEVKNLR